MNASMKKQILLALGIACLLQSELFAMRRPMGSAERQAAIQQAINKKDYDKANELAQGLVGPNKALFQSRINTLQQDEARRAPARVIAQDQRAAVDAVVMPAPQAAAALQQEAVQAPVQEQGNVNQPEQMAQEGAFHIPPPPPAPSVTLSQTQKASVEQSYNSALNIANYIIANADLDNNSNAATVAKYKIDTDVRPSAEYKKFATAVRKFLEKRWMTKGANITAENLDLASRAFEEGTALFNKKVQELYNKAKHPEVRGLFYNPSKSMPYTGGKPGAFGLNLATARPAEVRKVIAPYYDSDLIEIARALGALWLMFSNDHYKTSSSIPLSAHPFGADYDTAKTDMQNMMKVIEDVAVASFYIIGVGFGARKTVPLNVPFDTLDPKTKLFFSGMTPDEADPNQENDLIVRNLNGNPLYKANEGMYGDFGAAMSYYFRQR